MVPKCSNDVTTSPDDSFVYVETRLKSTTVHRGCYSRNQKSKKDIFKVDLYVILNVPMTLSDPPIHVLRGFGHKNTILDGTLKV